MQNGLLGAAKLARHVGKSQLTSRNIRNDASAHVVGHMHEPGCLGHDLASFQKALASPARDGVATHTKSRGGGADVHPAGVMEIYGAPTRGGWDAQPLSHVLYPPSGEGVASSS